MKRYISKNLKLVVLLFIFIIIVASFKIASAYFIGYSFNSLIQSDTYNFMKFLGLSAASLFIFIILMALKIHYENYVIQKMIVDVRKDIVKSISKANYSSFNDYNVGTYISWLSNDIGIIEQKGFFCIFTILSLSIQTLLSITALFTFHWSIIILSLVVTFLTIFLPSIMNKKIQSSSQNYSESLEELTSDNTSYMSGFDTLLSYDKTDILNEIIANTSHKVLKTSVRLKRDISIATFIGGSCNLFSQIGILLLSGILITYKIITFGALLTIESLTGTIFNSITGIMGLKVDLNIVKPIFEKFEKFRESIEIEDMASKKKDDFNEEIHSITLDKLGYAYDDKRVIDELSYTFNERNKYLITGESGSGKTTLLNILTLRLRNYFGKIYVNKTDISTIQERDFLKNVIYIAQSPYIFDNTIKYNVTLGDDYSDEEVINVLKLVKLDKIIEQNDGINRKLDGSGKSLSGGQRQRLALARGLIRNKKIVILDEITSNLDKENSKIVEDIILDNRDLMVIMVSHNVNNSNMDKFDRIINLSQN